MSIVSLATCTINMIIVPLKDSEFYGLWALSKARTQISTDTGTFLACTSSHSRRENAITFSSYPQVWVHSDREQLSVLNTFGWNRREVTRLPGEREGEGERETGGGEGGPKRVKKPRSECVQILHDGSEIGM